VGDKRATYLYGMNRIKDYAYSVGAQRVESVANNVKKVTEKIHDDLKAVS
jgi:hypothetical protein